MAATHRAPKQWCLSKTETITSFENWRQNLIYSLSLDANFSPYLAEGAIWNKKTKAQPLRGFTNDGEDVPAARRLTAQQKVNFLELMLGQIANYCPIISRNTLVKNSTSLEFIWQTIRQHFGFQVTGAHLIDFADIRLEPEERPEDLFQRLMAFVEDSLLKVNSLHHHGDQLTEDEELTPTLENLIVLTWLRLIHPSLPRLVKQRYGTELRSRTLASIKPEISQALDSLLDEIRSSDDAKILRSAVSPGDYHRPVQANRGPQRPMSRRPRPLKACPLCKQAGRSETSHFLSECRHLPESDRRYIVKARQLADIFDEDPDSEGDAHSPIPDTADDTTPAAVAFRIQTRQSPYIDVFHRHHTLRVTIDSGATGNMIRHSTAKRLGSRITTSTQSVSQADGSSQLQMVGETRLSFTRADKVFTFEGLVVENLDVDVLAGTPFMEANDIAVRPAKRQVILADDTTFTYGTPSSVGASPTARLASILRAPPRDSIIWPGEFIEIPLPGEAVPDAVYALEPRTDAPSVRRLRPSEIWPSPALVQSVAGRVRIPNLTAEPHALKRNEHFCQVNPVFEPSASTSATPLQTLPVPKSPHSADVALDPDSLLSADIRSKFHSLLQEYDQVFDANIEGYNGKAGPFEAHVNMGPVEPPQRKGRLPQYARDRLLELQNKFDELESLGVFQRPEDIGISVEYLNPSFLVRKPNGGSRLVTAFSDVGRYSKPQPSLMPNVDSTLRQIAEWKHLIASDLTSAFYQIPLSRSSMKYCGVATPFRGVRVYARCAMGMPGSETALEELMCRVLGDLLTEGVVVKLADDLYCGGNTPEELLHN